MVREGEGILREKKAPERGGHRGGGCRRNRGATPENSGKSPAKTKQGRPRIEFTTSKFAHKSYLYYYVIEMCSWPAYRSVDPKRSQGKPHFLKDEG